jgi:hypothetical protein
MSDGKSLWPRFSPEISFGHLLQAAVILVTIGGGAITSYLSLRSDIQQVRADLTVKVSEHEVRLVTMEHATEDQRKEVREFQRRDAFGDLSSDRDPERCANPTRTPGAAP